MTRPAVTPRTRSAPVAWRRGGTLGPLIRTAIALTFLGAATHLSGVIIRAIAVHRVPWGDMYEFVITLTCVAVLALHRCHLRFRPDTWACSSRRGDGGPGPGSTHHLHPGRPLVPALKSYWLAIHVAAMTLSTGIFFVGRGDPAHLPVRRAARASGGGGAPVADRGIFATCPGSEALDRLTYRTVVFAFPIWTFGIICGAIWADQAWGRYWGWDPVETWAFITWVVYAGFLHARATAGWRGKRAAYIQILGFCCLLFNVLVVQTSVTGLHSYAGLG